jgi:Protein of unknown function (DUF2637)
VILLAALAFVLSYGGIHALARQAGMSAGMARLFPIIFDAMLVVSCVAVLLLRGAGWWRRGYAWLITLVLLAAVAAGDAVHAAGTHLPHRPAAITAAVLPWVLLLLAFSLLLSMLRQYRHHRGALARQQAVSRAAAGLDPAVPLTGSTPPAANRSGLDALLSRDRTGPAAGEGTGPANATLPSRAPDAGGTKTDRRPAKTGTGAPRNGRANARPAAAKPAKSTEPTITQPIAPAGATKSAAKALDAADEPVHAQPSAAAAGAVAAAAATAAGLASGSSPRPADGASAAGQLPPAPDTQPATAAPDTQPATAAPDTQPATAAPDTQPASAAPDTQRAGAAGTRSAGAAATQPPATPDQPAGLAPAATPPAPGGPATQEPAGKPAADRAPATQAPASQKPATDTPADQVPAAQPAGTGASPGQPAPTPPPAAEEVTGRASEEVTGQADEAAPGDEAGPAAAPATQMSNPPPRRPAIKPAPKNRPPTRPLRSRPLKRLPLKRLPPTPLPPTRRPPTRLPPTPLPPSSPRPTRPAKLSGYQHSRCGRRYPRRPGTSTGCAAHRPHPTRTATPTPDGLCRAG